MIRKQDIFDRAGEWQLRHEVVEKDYVLGWLLDAIGRHPATARSWVFKGGTCLKKCYFETYRFSEDLDFSLAPEAAYTKADLLGILREVVSEATAASGIVFPDDAIAIRERKDKLGRVTFEGRIGYRGPLAVPSVPRILLDLTQHEPILDSVQRRAIYHPYPDALPPDQGVAAYSLDELFAEKTRALFERTRPRDLYDVVYIVDNRSDALNLPRIRDLFREKCLRKGLPAVTAATLLTKVREEPELRSEWSNMLAHQLPQLPPLDSLLDRLPSLLDWVDVPVPVAALAPIAGLAADHVLVAPAGVRLWGLGVPLEVVRFAGTNRLLIEFTYHGKHRVAEPYSLRRAGTGNLLLYAWERGAAHIKAFNVAEMRSVRATNLPFTPRYRVEFTGTGTL